MYALGQSVGYILLYIEEPPVTDNQLISHNWMDNLVSMAFSDFPLRAPARTTTAQSARVSPWR